MASFPATIIPSALGPVDRVHMTGNKVFLKSAGIRECGPTGGFDSMQRCYPSADM